MSSLINALQSFIAWFYSSVQMVVDFVGDLLAWLYGAWTTIQAVSNLVLPPPLQAVLGFMIAFLLIMLVVKVVLAVI